MYLASVCAKTLTGSAKALMITALEALKRSFSGELTMLEDQYRFILG